MRASVRLFFYVLESLMHYIREDDMEYVCPENMSHCFFLAPSSISSCMEMELMLRNSRNMGLRNMDYEIDLNNRRLDVFRCSPSISRRHRGPLSPRCHGLTGFESLGMEEFQNRKFLNTEARAFIGCDISFTQSIFDKTVCPEDTVLRATVD
ncbi:hypothetical protein Tco_0644404 [Tanacetum coccineum]